LTKYIEDPEYLEQILKYLCPYCESALKKPYKSKRECTTCDFEIHGNPQYTAYTHEENPIDYTYKTDTCPECESKHLFYEHDRKELVCLDCGLVLTAQHRYVGIWKVEYPFGLHTDSNFFL